MCDNVRHLLHRFFSPSIIRWVAYGRYPEQSEQPGLLEELAGLATSSGPRGHRVLGWIRLPAARNPRGQGYGFLNSDDFDGDIFYDERENPDLNGLPAMTQVEFVLAAGSQGRGKVRQSGLKLITRDLSMLVRTPMRECLIKDWTSDSLPRYHSHIDVDSDSPIRF